MHKNIFFFFSIFFFVFWKFWWKPGILIPDLYFYDIKYKPILSKKKHKSKSEEISNIEKYFFLLIFFLKWAAPDPTTGAGLGLARPVWTVPSTVHMLREQWRHDRDEAGEKGRGEGLTCSGCCRWRRCWRRQVAALVVAPVVRGGGNGSVCFSSLSSLFFILFSASSFFFLLVFPLSCALSLLFSSFFFALSFPVFIGKKQGRERRGRPLCCRPSNTWKALGKWGWCRCLFEKESTSFWRGRQWKTEEEKSSSSTASRIQGKKKTYSAVQKGTVSGFLFFFFFNEQCRKRHRFRQNSSFHLKGKGDKKACQSSHRSLICDLFNRVLNCNFDWKINAIAFLPKIKQQP